MRVGEILRVRVVEARENGVVVEAEGRRGFVQPIEIDWDPEVKAPAVLARNDQVEALVYAVVEGCFYASIKGAHPEKDPWRDPDAFRIGSTHNGVVTAIVEWGAAVKLRPGVSGMILGATTASVGDAVCVEVVGGDVAARKLELRCMTTPLQGDGHS